MRVYSAKRGETVYDQGGCAGTRLYAAAGNEYVRLDIQPGGGIPDHALPIAVSFCVLAGEGVCSVDGDEITVRAGEMLECPPDAPRGWRNDSDEPLAVLVIKQVAA